MDNCPDALERFVIKNEQNPWYARFWKEVNQECDPLAIKVLVEQFSVPDSYVLR